MKTVYLDVRTAEEYTSGHYPDAVHFPVELLQAGQFPGDHQIAKDDEIKVYCRSGGRAGVAAEILRKAGYYTVENVGGLGDIKK